MEIIKIAADSHAQEGGRSSLPVWIAAVIRVTEAGRAAL